MLSQLRLWFDPHEVRDVGETPDYRFSLANERTFLAWVRTALALVGGGLAVAQFLNTPKLPHLDIIIAVALMLLGGATAFRAVDHWIRSERAMRVGTDLPVSRFPAILAVALGVGAVVLAILALVGGTGR